MREIKFRGIRTGTMGAEWVYGHVYHDQKFRNHKSCQDVMIIRDETDEDFEVKEHTIGQFTGLLDKNGKEIYEGDVVKNTIGQIERVVFAKGCFQCALIEYPNRNLYILDSYSGYIEVIGNLHEVPDEAKL